MTFIPLEGLQLPDVLKAIDTTETALLRQDLESVVTKIDMKGTPLRKRWPRKKSNGLTHEYNQRTSLGSPASSFYADGKLPPDGTTRYLRKGKQVKALGESGKVTGLMIAGGGNFGDQLEMEQTSRMTSVLQQEEAALLAGDSTKGYAVRNDDNSQSIQYLEFDGMDRIIRQEGGQVIDAATFPDGAKWSIPLINFGIQLIYDANGAPACIVLGSRAKRFFNELLQSFMRYNGDGVVHVERQLGASVMFYDSDFGSLPILVSRYIVPDGSQKTKAYCLCETTPAEDIIEVREVKSIGMEPLAKIDDSERFMINEYVVPINRAPVWSAVYDNLSA